MDTFVKNGIFTKEELHARYEIMLEDYMKKIQIEGRVLGEIAYSYVLPPAIEYLTVVATNIRTLKEAGIKVGKAQKELVQTIAEHIDMVKTKTDKMVESRKKANNLKDTEKQAISYHFDVKESFDDIRYHMDKLEQLVDDKIWQLPKYRELLFLR
jgi:glutamine synthetase